MKVTVAKSAGFCFGVNRAVQMVFALLDAGKQVCTLGPIIHNPQTLQELESRGVQIVESPSQTPQGATLVIRSHGVSEAVLEEIHRLGIAYVDATCPFVAKIHKIVSEASAKGQTVLIAGNATHPEVEGIRGHCQSCYVFKNAKDLEDLTNNFPDLKNKPACFVAQTTFSVAEW